VDRPHRHHELDALRGLAAAVVVASHWIFNADGFNARGPWSASSAGWKLLMETPLNVVVSGEAMVKLFFVLSGFVLALPFLAGRHRGYRAFQAQRAWRLYPVAVLAGLGALAFVGVAGTTAVLPLTTPVLAYWQTPAHLSDLPAHVTLLWGDSHFDAPLWSLVQELRVGFVFPLLVAAVLARRPGVATALAAGGSLAVAALVPVRDPTSLANTACLLVAFVTGIELARSRTTLIARYEALSARARAGLLCAAATAMTAGSVLPGASEQLHRDGVLLLLQVGGAAVVIVAVLSDPLRDRLTAAVPQYLGRISYPLYLVHFPIMLALLRLTSYGLPVPLLVLVGVPLAVLVADVLHRYVEAPAMRLGRRRRATGRQAASAPAPAVEYAPAAG
jgi:peptidoglycan/LPS O-acetylase OafA/YrhL